MDVAYENGAALVRTGFFEPRHIFENGQAFRFFPCGANAYEGCLLYTSELSPSLQPELDAAKSSAGSEQTGGEAA